MRLLYWVLIGVVVVILCGVVYVWTQKPTVVLPTVTVQVPAATMENIKQTTNLNELGLRVRTDGKAFLMGDGQQLAQIDYTPETLANTLSIARKVSPPPENSMRALGLIPVVFPQLTTNALLTGLAAYYVLPVETTVRLVPG